MNIAAKVAADKEKYPERFCESPKCLWRLSYGPCPKHVEPEEICAPFGCGRPESHCNCP